MRVLRHEWTLAILGGLLLSIFLNVILPGWQTGTYPDLLHTLPQDTWDPSLVTYLIAWGGHALIHDPAGLWDINAFYPSSLGLAYTDSLLGYAPFAIIGGGPEAAVLRYNLIYIGAHALVAIGLYALARQLGLGRLGAALGGVALAVAPWRLAQTGHLHVLSVGGMLLALAMLARGHGVRWISDEPQPKRPWWALGGWLAATWQITIGFGVGLPFLYILLGVVIVSVAIWLVRSRVRRTIPPWPPREFRGARDPEPRRLLLADAAGATLFSVVAVLMALPYLKVLELYPYAKRDIRWVEFYSPPLRGLFIAPPESALWGSVQAEARAELVIPGEMSLLPGFLLIGLAILGLFFSTWPRRVRVWLAIGVVVSAALSLGTNGPFHGHLGYRLLLGLPGFEGIRTPGRLILWTTVLLALLAGGLVHSLTRAVWVSDDAPLGRLLVRVALGAPMLLVLLEGLPTTPHPEVPAPPAALAGVEAPYLVLPSQELLDLHVMLWSTDGFPDIVNGGSGLVPAELAQTRQVTQAFPDLGSATYLRAMGVKSVVVLPTAPQWQLALTAPVEDIGIRRELRDDAVILHL